MAQPQPPLNRPYQKEVGLGPRVDYAQLGVSTALFGICGTIIAGAVAYARGNKAFYDKMFRTRMIVVATTLGYYAGASGYLPPPPLLNTIMGREPRALPDAPQLSALGARRAPSSLVTEKDK